MKNLTKKQKHLNSLTKKQLTGLVEASGEMLKSRDRQIAEMDDQMVNAVESIHELEQEIAFLKGVLEGRQKSKMKFNGDADFRAPVDGTLTCGNLSLKVREGYTSDEMDALMEVGEEMIEWLEEKGIELDGQGTSDDN